MFTENFINLPGAWKGTNKLIMKPDDPVHECETMASVEFGANGKCLMISYQWSFEDDDQEGLILVNPSKDAAAKIVWIDSWHQNDFMLLSGRFSGSEVSTKANYTQPEYGDWAWRITLDAAEEDEFSIRMFNIFPDGTEVPAVEASYKRARRKED